MRSLNSSNRKKPKEIYIRKSVNTLNRKLIKSYDRKSKLYDRKSKKSSVWEKAVTPNRNRAEIANRK